MAVITREYLEGSIANVRKQREEALSTANQCGGALEVLEALLARLNEPETPNTEE